VALIRKDILEESVTLIIGVDDRDNNFLQNLSSDKSHTASHPRREHSSYLLP
jgi:hypothetical protein